MNTTEPKLPWEIVADAIIRELGADHIHPSTCDSVRRACRRIAWEAVLQTSSPAPSAPDAATGPVTPASVLRKAIGHMEARAATYDNPDGERSMADTVAAFNALAGADLTETEGWLFLALLKVKRAMQARAYHADSFEDLAAYAGLAAEARAKQDAAVQS